MESSGAMTTEKRSVWSLMTPKLLFSCFCLLVGDMLFGYDTGSFGGILANPGFINQFGMYRPGTDSYEFSSLSTSLLSSIPFIGKFIGCLAAGPLIEKFGHRLTFVILSGISVVGVTLEMTAADNSYGSGRLSQFIVGRVVVYISVGLVEVDITTYQSEIVPASFRGFVVVSLQLFLNVGTLVATGINRAFADSTTSVGWRTVTGVQFIYPLLIVIFVYFIPDSPRWLLSKDRAEDAAASLSRIRPKEDNINGSCDAEIQAIRAALQDHVHKAPWTDLIRGSNFRRTMLVVVFYFFQQTTGQAFVSTYQTTFYAQNGYEDQAFTYPVITSCLNTIAVMPCMIMIDRIGRRYSLLISFASQGFWMYLMAGIGQKLEHTLSESNTIVASFMLFSFSYNMGGASIPYLLGSEIPNAAVREKTQSLGTSWNVLWGFVTNFIIPYMIDSIHFQVGWVFGSISILALFFTFFFLPETKGRALEEIDEVFEKRFNPFHRVQIHAESEPHAPQIEGKVGLQDGYDNIPHISEHDIVVAR